MPRAYLRTFGCQMNEQDSSLMEGMLHQMGYELSGDPREADLILINTCHIREKAYQKAMSEIGRWKIDGGNSPVLGVTGCIASQLGGRLMRRFPTIDFVLGTDHIARLPEAIRTAGKGARPAWHDFQALADYEFPRPLEGFGRKVKAYVTVMKGCDNNCSFCIVPFTRGPELSCPPDQIIEEVKRLREQGVREVMLLGQNVNSYGKGFRLKFAGLLQRIERETGIERIRFTSPHPKDLSSELIREYGRNRSLCPQIHLPVQSGSDRILRKMRRAYTRATYLRRVVALREVSPEVAVTTDFIVGFPGETEGDFAESLGLIETVGYDQSYSFEYSPRPGTEAAGLPDDVPPAVKRRRLQALQNLQEEVALRKNLGRIGTVEEVLVEGPSLEGQGQLTGRTPHGRIVNFDGDSGSVGAILKVRVEAASAYSLRGRVL